LKPALFLKQFLAHPATIGAIAASSTRLAELITESAALSHANVVVEWGPGTGVFTERILRKLPDDAHFLAMELNPVFADLTRKRCPGAQIIHDSAVQTEKYLRASGFDRCDRIISGLPWGVFPADLQRDLLAVLDRILAPGGLFLTFAYPQGFLLSSAWRFRRNLRSVFSDLKTTRLVWTNFPPAFIYRGIK
jgi:phosphatidylethanolamine/phosphatidyl-N-methylethanolamine N-methyltransferase